MADDRKHDDQKKPPQEAVLSEEVVEQAKKEILFGVGYKRPPQHTQFKKEKSGNPKGRPRNTGIGLDNDRSANAMALKEGQRLISVREGDEVREISTIEAVFRSQSKSAIGGSAYAQKHQIQRFDWAEREHRQQIAEDVEIYTYYVDKQRAAIAEAKANGLPLPDPLPHPDDVVIDPDRGVRFIGPFTEEGRGLVEKNARFRDVFIMQDALDRRIAGKTDDADLLNGPGSALVFAQVMNAGLPERYRLSEMMIILSMDRYDTWSKRKLLKEVYGAWRSLGVRVQRGRTLGPLRWAKQVIDRIAEYRANGRDDDIARFTALPLHVQIDALATACHPNRFSPSEI